MSVHSVIRKALSHAVKIGVEYRNHGDMSHEDISYQLDKIADKIANEVYSTELTHDKERMVNHINELREKINNLELKNADMKLRIEKPHEWLGKKFNV